VSPKRGGVVLVAALLGVACGGGEPAAPAAGRPPNVVLILIDDLGWSDLGAYGNRYHSTPNIDRISQEGMRFTSAYAAAPVCSPTRASLMTGKSPARLGFTGHITAILRYRHPPDALILPPEDHMRLRLEEVSIAEALKPAGYVSASIGKWHLGPEGYWPLDQGFDVNVGGWTHGSPPSHFFPYQNAEQEWNASIPTLSGGDAGEYLTDRMTDEAIAFIEANRDRPFFCYLTHYAVHTPIQAPEDLVARYAAVSEEERSSDPVYAAMVESVDTGVGRLVATLERLGLAENTLLVVFSDNGGLSEVTSNAPLRAGKQTLYEGGLRVPLIVRWPGRVRPGSVSDVPVISHDLFPTLVEAAGLEPSVPDLDGLSLLPLLQEVGTLPERPLFFYYPQYARRPGAVVLESPYKLIEHYDPPGVELYDLSRDLGEESDLAAQQPERVEAMRGRLEAWLDEVKAIRHTANPAAAGSR